MVKVLDSHCPVFNLTSSFLPIFLGRDGGVSRVQNYWVAPRLTLLFLLLSLIKWIPGTFICSLQKLNLIHKKGHKVLKFLFCYSFSTFCFHRNSYLLRIIWRAQIHRLLLSLNISHFTILYFILDYSSIFSKATTFNHYMWW